MLSSLQNPLIKQIRKLHRAQERKQQQRFLLEGTHLLEEACKAGYPLETLCYTPEWQSRHPALWETAMARAERPELVTIEVLKAIATTVEPDGVVATGVRRPLPPEQTLPIATLGLGLETLQDPGNLGTIIRTCVAAGVEGLWVSADSVDLDHPKVLRASTGQWFHLPMAVSADLRVTVAEAKQQGIQVVATSPQASHTYWQVDWTEPTLVLLGNEGAGLSAGLTSLADRAVRIPQRAATESLNVAITTALILYEIQRQRGGMG